MMFKAFALALVGAPLLGLAACDGEKLDPEDGLEREDLGSFTTDTGGGADIPFEPAAGAVSALVHCGPYGYDILATAETITGPGDSAIYDMEDPTGTAMRVGIMSDLLPVLLPVSPDLDLAPLVLELVDTDDRFGLETDVDDHDVVGDVHHESHQDHSRPDSLARKTLFEQFSKRFSHYSHSHGNAPRRYPKASSWGQGVAKSAPHPCKASR